MKTTLAVVAALLASGLLAVLPGAASAAAQLGRDQGQGAALAAQVISSAARIHQLTGQLDQARRGMNSAAAQLVSANRQHDLTVAALRSDQAVLHAQAVTAYMHGPSSYQASASLDLTVGREYLNVATGNLSETTDRLRAAATDLRHSQSALRAAQQASVDAVAVAQHTRDQALVVAGQEQAQLDRIQRQVTVAKVVLTAQPAKGAPVPPSPSQGLPVNNGLVAVVKAVASLVVSAAPPLPSIQLSVPPPVAAAPPAASTAAATGATAATGSTTGGVWLSLRQCESGDNYAADTGNGYFGAYQFNQGTWTGLGYPGRPDQEPPAMQDKAAAQLQARSGWGQWPACAAALGLA